MSAGAERIQLPGRPARVRRLLLPLAIVAGIAAFVLLAIAETVWIPEGMPREFEARESVVLLPAESGHPDSTWRDALKQQATSDAVLTDVLQKVTPHDPKTGQALTLSELRSHIVVTAQCVQANDDGRREAARLAATVRGLSRDEAVAVSREWISAARTSVTTLATPDSAQYFTAYTPCTED